MALDTLPSQSFPTTTGATAYPLLNNPAGTTTADSSAFITKRVTSVDAVIVEVAGSTAGTITISDHAGTAGTAIVLTLPNTAATIPAQEFPFPAAGIAVKWEGIRAVVTGTGGRVRVCFTAGR